MTCKLQQPTIDAFSRAADFFGRQAAMSRYLSVTPQSVNQWYKGRKKIPRYTCIVLEKKTGVPVEELRPDLDWSAYRAQEQESVA